MHGLPYIVASNAAAQKRFDEARALNTPAAVVAQWEAELATTPSQKRRTQLTECIALTKTGRLPVAA
jgi:hypothetical protein